MKKLFTILTLVFIAGVFSIFLQSCDSKKQSANEANSSTEQAIVESEGNLTAFYFHATKRCVTCEAVEKVAKQTISENYKGKVQFVSINREEAANKVMVEKYKISGQTLLLVKGDEKVDLTSPAFMYALSKPEKLETKLKLTIDSML